MSKTAEPAPKITPDDLESKLRTFQNQIQGKVDDKKSTLVTLGAGVGVVLLIVFFLLGKRAGKKKSTIVQIKRL